MAKKILAIFFVSILLCYYIIPTTSAFADVVIGDNDSYAVTELGVENGKKIATMEAILQLLESGVSEINFNDISDLDDYLEDFYDELTNVNYQDVSNEILAGAYNDVKELKQWIDDRGEYIATYYKDYLNSADEGLSDIFNNIQMRIPKTKLTGTSLNGFRSLSRFHSEDPIPTPNPDTNYLSYIRKINENNNTGTDFFWSNLNGASSLSYCIYDTNTSSNIINRAWDSRIMQSYDPLSIYITGSGNQWFFTVSNFTLHNFFLDGSNSYPKGKCMSPNNSLSAVVSLGSSSYNINYKVSSGGPYTSLANCFGNIENTFRNVNIYVNGDIWAMPFNPVVASPTLDIDGFIKLYGNNNPIQYEFPNGTQIDYNTLYTTIYNAIRDNLPLDMQTINNNQVYYDSHDTVYSPTIYNYYGKDGDDENDWIDSILDYATIPDFNAVLGTVAVLDAPFVNGITIVNAGVTDVIPTDILVVLGGFFVLVLFVCIINRMSE